MGDYIVHSVQFRPDGYMEISFAQDDEETEKAAMLRTVIFDPDTFRSEVSDIQADLDDLITEVMVYMRNPDARTREPEPEPEVEVEQREKVNELPSF